MRGLEPKRTRYAGVEPFSLFAVRRRFKSGGSSAPPPVDPTALANAQTAANISTAQEQSALNNVNTTSPLGQTNFNQGLDGRWSLDQQLNPSLQGVFNNQTGLSGLLAGLGGDVANIAAYPALGGEQLTANALQNIGPTATGSPAPGLQTSLNTNFGPQITQAQNAAYNQQTGYLDPQFAQKQSDLTQQLADQGIQPGTAASSRAQGDLGRQETLAYQQAQDAAVQAGNQEQNTLFGQQATAGQFANTAAQQMWQDPLTALQSLTGTGTGVSGASAQDLATLNPLSGFQWGGQLPTFGGSPTTVYPSNVVGAGGVASQNAANRFAAGNTLNNQLFNGLGTLATGANALSGGALGSALGSGIGSLFGLGGAGAAAGTGAALIGADAGSTASYLPAILAGLA